MDGSAFPQTALGNEIPMHEWQEDIESKYHVDPGIKVWHYKSPHGVYYQSYAGPEHWSSCECLGQWTVDSDGTWIRNPDTSK